MDTQAGYEEYTGLVIRRITSYVIYKEKAEKSINSAIDLKCYTCNHTDSMELTHGVVVYNKMI